MESGALVAEATLRPEGSSTVETTRTLRAVLLRFSTSVRMESVASPERTWDETRVPHFFTWTGLVFTSQTWR